MDIIFKNSYTRNKELAKEIYRYYYFFQPLVIIVNVLLVISFSTNILTLIFQQTCNWDVILLAPLFLTVQVLLYNLQVSRMIKQDKEYHGKEIEFDIIVTENYIQNSSSTGAVTQIEYNKIKSAVQTKNLILIRTKANMLYIIRKDAFTIGNKDEFIAFLRSKGFGINN